MTTFQEHLADLRAKGEAARAKRDAKQTADAARVRAQTADAVAAVKAPKGKR